MSEMYWYEDFTTLTTHAAQSWPFKSTFLRINTGDHCSRLQRSLGIYQHTAVRASHKLASTCRKGREKTFSRGEHKKKLSHSTCVHESNETRQMQMTTGHL